MRVKSSLPFRKYARRLHLWLGLSVGLLFTLICLSGAAVVFYVEIDQWLHPSLSQPASGEPDWDQAVTTLRSEFPDKTGPWRLEITPEAHVIPTRYYNPSETQHEGFAPLLVWLSADGHHILRQDYWGHHVMTWLYNLHFQLLLGNTGTLILGYMGLVMLFLLGSGLIAWWPKRGQWQRRLGFKRKASTIGLLYDWHKLLGLISFIPLFMLVVTGIMLALPKPTAQLLTLLPGQTAPSPLKQWHTHPAPHSKQQKISIAQALHTLNEHYPQATLAWIEVPPVNGGYYKFRIQLPNDLHGGFPIVIYK